MHRLALLFTSLLSTVGSSQVPTGSANVPPPQGTAAAGGALPAPGTKEHQALRAFVGDWDNTFRMLPIPGVPGIEKSVESKGSEHVESICNGLFLKWAVDGSFQGQPFLGLYLIGYDPFAKSYTALWVESEEEWASPATGVHDEQRRTWEFTGRTARGPMRTVMTFKDADDFTAVSYAKFRGSNESPFMEIARTRASSVPPARQEGVSGRQPSNEHARLLEVVGDWDATVRFRAAPGAPWTEEKGTERVAAICRGKWLWSDFRGQLAGSPLEGHRLTGYDSGQKTYVSWWIDSTSPVMTASAGRYDQVNRRLVMDGAGLDAQGRKTTRKETMTWMDDDTRLLRIEVNSGNGATEMEITCKRKHKG